MCPFFLYRIQLKYYYFQLASLETDIIFSLSKYKLFIEFKGTRYSGWQKQPNAKTIEEEIEKAFSRILQQKINIVGQGRTDSGVHAEKQIAHVDIEEKNNVNDLLYALRGVLPRDISVWKMEKTDENFHARFDAKSRQYRYQILTRPSPLLREVAIYEAHNLNYQAMRECAEQLIGKHDFENFSKANKDQKNAVCEVTLSNLIKEEYLITYRIKANRFVHHLVRRLVGSMLQVGKGKMRVEHFEELLNEPKTDLRSTGITGRGLILEDVIY